MSVTPGTRLGPYLVSFPIGSGGMGEVYKATDTRLDRVVAIKVLPEHVAADPELRQRFEREAKTLAALSHRTSVRCTTWAVKKGSTSW
jgi:serine/threonine-protein kinase